MSDVAQANFLVEQIGGGKHVGAMLHAAWKALNKRFPHQDEPEKRWTENRLKSWRYNESDIVRHSQMVELFELAEELRIEKARKEHAEYTAKTASLRQMAQLRSAALNRDVAQG